jgi:hypothetical protein
MLRRKALIAAAGATIAAGMLAFAPAAKADRIGFNLSIGGPGYGVTVGNAPYYRGYGPRYYGPRYRHWAPAPVYVAPPVVYRPPVVYTAPVPRYGYRAPYYPGRVYYRY